MARDGSGTMSIDYADFQSGANIVADELDANFSTIVAEITNSVAVDGQSTMTGDLAMGTNKITGVGDPTSAQDVVTKAYFEANASALVWLAGTTVSVAAASVNFPRVFFDNNTDYDHFLVEIQDLSPATDSVRAWMRVTSNNGSTYEATAYSQNSLRVNSGSVAGFQTGTSAAQIIISDNSEVIGSNATKAYGGTLKFRNPLSTTNYKHFQIDGQAQGGNAGSNYAMRTAGAGMWASTAPATGFQILFSSGNVDGGIINVYGMKNS